MIQLARKLRYVPVYLSAGSLTIFFFFSLISLVSNYRLSQESLAQFTNQLNEAKSSEQAATSELTRLKSQDPYKTNDELEASISSMKQAFSKVSVLMEHEADLRKTGTKKDFSPNLLESLNLLASFKYEEAKAVADKTLESMNKEVVAAVEKQNSASNPSVAASNSIPGSGFSKQAVTTERGTFTVAMVAAESGSAKVIIDTAAENDCGNNCATLSLAEYVSRNGGFAGINGGYFCPPDYSQCAGKVNSFDTLVLNGVSKHVFNRDNNVYSVVPLVVADNGNLHFYDRTLDWGPDTSKTGALANYPMLLRGNQVAVNEGSLSDTQRSGKSPRGFIAKKGGQIIIGHVLAASIPDSASVLKALGVDDALNLDGGGSTALWYGGGYKLGPGRSLPVAIILK